MVYMSAEKCRLSVSHVTYINKPVWFSRHCQVVAVNAVNVLHTFIQLTLGQSFQAVNGICTANIGHTADA